MLEKRHALLTRQSLPTMLATWFTIVNETYVDVVLAAAGARAVICRSMTAADEPTNGFPAVTYTCDVTWH